MKENINILLKNVKAMVCKTWKAQRLIESSNNMRDVYKNIEKVQVL